MAKRQERSRKTVEKLMEAATVCFARKGYDGCSIADIAAQADMSQGSLYVHFENKEALFKAIILHEYRLITERIVALGRQGATTEALFGILMECGQDDHGTMDHRLMLEITAVAARDPSIREAFAEGDRTVREAVAALLHEILKERTIARDRDARAITEWALTFLDGMMTRMALGISTDLDGQRRDFMAFVEYLLAADSPP